MRWFNALMGGLLALSAGLQLNDPDPVGWVAAYLLGGAACAAWHKGWLSRWKAWMLSFGYLVGAAWVWLSVPDGADIASALGHWKMVGVGAEAVREAIGLTVVAAWVGCLGWCQCPGAPAQ